MISLMTNRKVQLTGIKAVMMNLHDKNLDNEDETEGDFNTHLTDATLLNAYNIVEKASRFIKVVR